MQTSIKLNEFESQAFEDMWVIKAGTLRNLGALNKQLDELLENVGIAEAQIARLEGSLIDRETKILAGISAEHGVTVPPGLDLPDKKPEDGRLKLSWDEPKAQKKKAGKKTRRRKKKAG